MEKETVFILLLLLKPMTKTSQLNWIAIMLYWWVPCAKNINSLFFAIILMKITWKTWKRKKRLYNLLLKPRTKTSQLNGKSKEDVFRCVPSPKWPFKMVAFENIRFSTLFAARDVSRGGTSATQPQKFHTDDVKYVQNPVRSPDWSTE